MAITPRDRKILIFGGIAASILIALRLIIIPAWETFQKMDDSLYRELKSYEGYIKMKHWASLPSQDEITKALARMHDRFYMVDKLEEASLKLLEVAEDTATAEGIVWNKKEIIPPISTPDEYPKIMVEVSGSCQPEQLAALLRRLENNKKFLWIEQLSYEKTGSISDLILTLATIFPKKVQAETEGRIN